MTRHRRGDDLLLIEDVVRQRVLCPVRVSALRLRRVGVPFVRA